MKIAVVGTWHLGCVTAACMAHAGFDVIAYDPHEETIKNLQQNKPPIFEPGLQELLQSGQAAKTLRYTSYLPELAEANVIWITFDTPVDDQDHADVNFVVNEIEKVFSVVQDNALIMISSQIPVGTTRQLQQQCGRQFPEKNIFFAYIPENLRLGKAIEVFSKPDRVIVGLQEGVAKSRIEQLFRPFTDHLMWMSIESAEMTKHALNAFLASSVVFINELALLCERVGADAKEVEQGLKSEERIGSKAYLRAGNAIAGGTLARDVKFLLQVGKQQKLSTPMFQSLLESNENHKLWACQRILTVIPDLSNQIIAVLGLTYKPGTNTLRRSAALETCRWLSEQGAKIVAHDPVITSLPEPFSKFIALQSTIDETLQNADAVIIATEWPVFQDVTADQLVTRLRKPFVFDASGFIRKHISMDARIQYYSVGSQL